MRWAVSKDGGFTLLEVMVVMIILVLSVALVSPSIVTGLGRFEIKATAKKAASTLEYAKNRALRERTVYYVEATEDRLTVRRSGSRGHEKEVPIAKVTEVVSSGPIAFYPGGGSSGGFLRLKGDGDEVSYTFLVDPSTARVRIAP